jgi:hypothetical protein
LSITIPLGASVSVKLSASGGGTVTLGPTIPGVIWYPSSVAVMVSPTSTTVVSQFFLYLGGVVAANLQGGTYTGDINSAGLSVQLYTGQVLTGVWAGGNPLATATMTISGTQQVPS